MSVFNAENWGGSDAGEKEESEKEYKSIQRRVTKIQQPVIPSRLQAVLNYIHTGTD